MYIKTALQAALLVFLSFSNKPLVAQYGESLFPAGSEERRKICESFADLYDEAYEYLASGKSIGSYRKEMEIAVAGKENGQAVLALALVGALLVEQYIKENLGADELRLDFLHPCITTNKDLATVVTELWLEKAPEDHPSRNRMLGKEESDKYEFEE